MNGSDTREHRVAALVRQLWLGLSAYRLFPGATERAGFVAASGRIEQAARDALADGLVDVEIHGESLWLDARPLPSEDAVARLALVCFERRVERLVVREVPDAQELRHLYDVLSTPPSELQEAGAAEELLRATGVRSIELARIGPAPVKGADHVPAEMADLARVEIPDADVLASELMVEDLGGDAERQAETILARLREVSDELHVEPSRGIDLQSAFHDAIGRLPGDVRRSLVELLVERVSEDPLAQRLIGAMSNAELTRALVDLGRDRRHDPVELARRLASAGVRHLDIVDLTTALEAGREEAGTIIAGLEQLGIELSGPATGGSVTDVLAEYLAATQTEDARTMRRALASDADDARGAALLAFGDYLSLEHDVERVGEVLDAWAASVGEVIRAGDRGRLVSLVESAKRPLAEAADERTTMFEAYTREALDAELLLELAPPLREDEPSPLPALLEPFGDLGVEVLLDVLADEQDRDRRALLLAVLRQAAAGHVGPVAARLDDPRWYVVRNAVSVLGSVGGHDVLERLAGAARHGAPGVRREAARALVLAGGTAAVPYLADLARDGGEDVVPLALGALAALVGPEASGALGDVARSASAREIRVRALEELAARPDGTDVLGDLAAGRTPPRLPWRLRRLARRLLRGSGKGSR